MGDAADALINGFQCQECGEIIDGEEPGYARCCSSCGGTAENSANDQIEQWRQEKEESRARKSHNLTQSIALLDEKKIPYKQLSLTHYRIAEQWDYWPSTGLYIHMKTKKRGRGVFNLIKMLGAK